MKIKTFEFLITNQYGNRVFSSSFENDYKTGQYVRSNIVSDPDVIDDEINNFCDGKRVIDVKVQTYVANRHNNGYGDSIVARYIILYED